MHGTLVPSKTWTDYCNVLLADPHNGGVTKDWRKVVAANLA